MSSDNTIEKKDKKKKEVDKNRKIYTLFLIILDIRFFDVDILVKF